jgi:hypothetical protein
VWPLGDSIEAGRAGRQYFDREQKPLDVRPARRTFRLIARRNEDVGLGNCTSPKREIDR